MSKAKPNTTVDVKVHEVKRIRNSVNGGPRWEVIIDGWTRYRTAADTQVAWNNNLFMRLADAELVRLTLNGRGTIVDAEILSA